MLAIHRILQWLVIIVVVFSDLLLGIAHRDFNIVFVALGGVFAAFIVVDWAKWFYLRHWMANVLAILVTWYVATGFIAADNTVLKLFWVGKLMVYLQIILLFQEKTARVYWQVLALSLIQVVIGSVFSYNYQGGLLFLLCMGVCGLALAALHWFHERDAIRKRDEEVRKLFQKRAADLPAKPIVLFSTEQEERGIFPTWMKIISILCAGCLIFGTCLFFLLPRQRTHWSGVSESLMGVSGFSKSMDMNYQDKIYSSTDPVMTVSFIDPKSNEIIVPAEEPYFKGMTMPNIKIVDNRTTWKAAYEFFEERRDIGSILPSLYGDFLIQKIELESTSDPLLFTVIPAASADANSRVAIDYNWALDCISRSSRHPDPGAETYDYTMHVGVRSNKRFHRSTPYQFRRGVELPLTEQANPGHYAWLTHFDPERYPSIVAAGQEIADQAQQERPNNHLYLAAAMEKLFLNSSEFLYTLDYSNIEFDRTIDPIEDFFANHRHGHCEYYASALVLMLRSQGIPARVVVGYRGGNVNSMNNKLDVLQKHSHAWVEAYIRPKDCTQDMLFNSYGAWLTLDPTPGRESSFNMDSVSTADMAVDVAKTVWEDYIVGLESDRSLNAVNDSDVRMGQLLDFLDIEWWRRSLQQASFSAQNSESRWPIIVILTIFIGGLIQMGWWSMYRYSKKKPGRGRYRGPLRTPLRFLRRQVGELIQNISPKLGEWIAGDVEESQALEFYYRLEDQLSRLGFERSEEQTQREFAQEVTQQFQDSRHREWLDRLVNHATEAYYRIRFGGHQMTSEQKLELTQQLDQFDSDIKLLLEETAKPLSA